MSLEEAFDEWERTVPTELRSDVLWRSTAYRLATFVSDFIWPDLARLEADHRTVGIAGQLAAAVGSIGANYAEASSPSRWCESVTVTWRRVQAQP